MVAIGGSRPIMVYPMPAIISRDPKRVGSGIGDPRQAQRSWALHDLHLAAGVIQTVRARPLFVPACERSIRLCQATAHTRLLRAHHPSYFHSMFANFHTRSRYPFSSDVFSFSISKHPVDKRCGSMQDNTNGKLNYLGQYFVDLLLGQRPAKDFAISSVPSIRRSDD
jgi:hypothetical protein